MSRIADALTRARAEGRIALMPFIVAGHPSPDATAGLIRTLFESGADVVELGVPFSDPLADGATNQHANEVALRHGMTLARCLDVIRDVRSRGVDGAIALMGYYNPILAYGLDRLVADAAAAGVDGLIVVDLPPEESDDLRERCRAHAIDLIYLLAPTSSDRRIALVAKRASGFVYCVSVAGVTGARDRLPGELPAFLRRVRAQVSVPLVVGFGISKPEHIEALRGLADGAVVGSALVNVIEHAPPGACEANVRDYVGVLTGRSGARR